MARLGQHETMMLRLFDVSNGSGGDSEAIGAIIPGSIISQSYVPYLINIRPMATTNVLGE